MSSSERAPDIYVRMLMPEVHGYPLWVPKPSDNLPPDYIRDGIQIGDLGYLDEDGYFVYLFNVGKGIHDPVNVDRTPDNFSEPLQGIHDLRNQTLYLRKYPNNHPIKATSSKKKSIGGDISVQASAVAVLPSADLAFKLDFTSSSTKAAYLVLPQGGKSSKYNYPQELEQYAIDHAHEWYEHYNRRGRGFYNGRLYLVTGWEKCRSWANACYSHTAGSRAVSLRLATSALGASIGGTVHCSWEVEIDSGVHHQSYPEYDASSAPAPILPPDSDPPEAPENQTILLRGFCISVREKNWADWVDNIHLRKKEPEVVKAKGKKGKTHDRPPQAFSIPYRREPERSMTPAATETGTTGTSGTAQGDGVGTDMGAARPEDSEIEGSSYDEYSGKGVSESSEDESETDTSVMDIPYDHTTMQADTLVQQLPVPVKIVHPLALINKHILDTYPDATVALTHDDFEWTAMENDIRNPLNAMELAMYAVDTNLVSINESETTPNAWVAKRQDIVPDRFSRQNDIFALIIGIDKYQCKRYNDLQGACSDANKFEAYLIEALRTPKANIVSLRDGKATRSAIIDELIKMKDNTVVQQDAAAVIIYFAGYGAATTDPVGRTDGNTSNEKIGMLCPTDIGILDKSDGVVNGIPARTINQLLLELSFVNGNNITLILDCSYAAVPSDTQKPADVPAGAELRQIFDPPKLSPGCDPQIYSGPACSPLQFAYESQGEGHFTCALLNVMKRWPISELTNKSLIHHLDMPGYQTPLSEGGYINRCLFNSQGRTADSSRILCHHEKDQPYFTLYAGSDHDIMAGSVFEIHGTDLPDKQYPFTTATAEKVEASVSFLKPADQTIFTVHKNRRVWYARPVDNLLECELKVGTKPT